MHIIYKNKGVFSRIEVYLEKGTVFYKQQNLVEKNIFQVPAESFNTSPSFSRTHHAPLFIAPAFLFILAVRLVIARWSVGGWALYLGLSVVSLISIGVIYYSLIGKDYGEVELHLGDFKLTLYMKKQEYTELQKRLDNINF